MTDATSTLRAIVARLIRRELARLGIQTFTEYRVVRQSGAFVDLQIVRKAAGMPDLTRILARPAAAGYTPTFKLGSLVLVGFVEGNPARPFLAFGPEVGSSTPPVVAIDADNINLGRADAIVVRDGDTVSITPGNGSGPVTGVLSITVGQGTPPAKSKVKA